MSIKVRALQLPEDYEAIVKLVNLIWSEPTTAGRLQDDDAKLYEVGHTWLDENGLLAGYDRERVVAVHESGEIIGYLWSWRAPWTEPGYLCNTLVVAENWRNRGVGGLLLRHAALWGSRLGASTLITEVWDDHPAAVDFAIHRGFSIERHGFQSLLSLEHPETDLTAILSGLKEPAGIRFLTLADEPGEESELKLYQLYQESLVDIPGFMGEVPDINEWRKWYLKVDGFAPELVLIAADGDQYVGISNLLHNAQTNGMYHEYTGVSRNYRGRGIAYALKVKSIGIALQRKASYLRTDNDSTNEAILNINRRLGYLPLRGSYRVIAPIEHVLDRISAAK